jgi:ABC-type uncharacterized transport system auxiliary subunit
MQHTIKTYRKVAGLVCLAVALTLPGCSCNSKKNESSGADTTTVKDSAGVKKDSTNVVKKDSDSTAMKMAPTDSLASPASHTTKKDTTVKPRPIDRKTKA